MEQLLNKYVVTTTKHKCGSTSTSLIVNLSSNELTEMTNNATLLPQEPYLGTLEEYYAAIVPNIQVAFCFDNKPVIVHANPREPVSYAYLRAVNSYLGTSRTYKWLMFAPCGIDVKSLVSEVNQLLNVRRLQTIQDVLVYWSDLLKSSTFPCGQDLSEYFTLLSYLVTVTYPSYRDMSRLVKSITLEINYLGARTTWDWNNLHKSLSVVNNGLVVNCSKVLYCVFRYPIYYFFLFKYLDGNENCQINDTICTITTKTYKGLRKRFEIASNLRFEGEPFLKQYILSGINKVLDLIDEKTYNNHPNKSKYLLDACIYLESSRIDM